jgi:hypothetical protein
MMPNNGPPVSSSARPRGQPIPASPGRPQYISSGSMATPATTKRPKIMSSAERPASTPARAAANEIEAPSAMVTPQA